MRLGCRSANTAYGNIHAVRFLSNFVFYSNPSCTASFVLVNQTQVTSKLLVFSNNNACLITWQANNDGKTNKTKKILNHLEHQNISLFYGGFFCNKQWQCAVLNCNSVVLVETWNQLAVDMFMFAMLSYCNILL